VEAISIPAWGPIKSLVKRVWHPIERICVRERVTLENACKCRVEKRVEMTETVEGLCQIFKIGRCFSKVSAD
jgi:hypothetical protein